MLYPYLIDEDFLMPTRKRRNILRKLQETETQALNYNRRRKSNSRFRSTNHEESTENAEKFVKILAIVQDIVGWKTLAIRNYFWWMLAKPKFYQE